MSGLPEKPGIVVKVKNPAKTAKPSLGPVLGTTVPKKKSLPETLSPLRGSYRTAAELEREAAAAEEAERLRRREGLKKAKTEKKNPDILKKPGKSPVAKGKKLETPEEYEEEKRKYGTFPDPVFPSSLRSDLPETISRPFSFTPSSYQIPAYESPIRESFKFEYKPSKVGSAPEYKKPDIPFIPLPLPSFSVPETTLEPSKFEEAEDIPEHQFSPLSPEQEDIFEKRKEFSGKTFVSGGLPEKPKKRVKRAGKQLLETQLGAERLIKGVDFLSKDLTYEEILEVFSKEIEEMPPERREEFFKQQRRRRGKKSPEKKESRSFFDREKMSMFRSSRLPERRETLSKDKKSLGPRAKGDRGIAYDIETDEGEINIYNGSGFSNPIYYFVNGDKTDKDDFAERLTMFLDFNKFPTVQIQKAGSGGLDEVPNSGYVIEGIKKLVGIKSVGPDLIKQMEDDLKFRLDAAMRNGQTKASIKIAKEIEKFNKNRKILEDSIKKGEVAIKDPYKDRKFEGSDNVYQLPVAETDIISILKANGIDSAQARDFVGTLMNSGYARAIDEMIKAKKDKPAEGADAVTISAYRIVRGSIPGRKPTKERSVLPDRLKKNTYLQDPNSEEVITYTRDDRAKYYDEADVRRGNELYKDKVRTEIIEERINKDNRAINERGLKKVKADIEKGLSGSKDVVNPPSSSSSSSSLVSGLDAEDFIQ